MKNRPKRDPSFNIYEFKYWLGKQPNLNIGSRYFTPKEISQLKGSGVESRLGVQRLQKQIAAHNPDLNEGEVNLHAKCFKEDGGTVANVDDLNVIIEMPSGKCFSLPKAYTKLATK